MSDFYRENILDHYKNPRNFGTIDHPDISHQENNPLCGDVVRIDLKLDGEKIAEVKFSGQGCAISQASASMLTEMIAGHTLDEVKKIGKEEILDNLGIPLGPVRLKCALLALKVLKAGVYGLSGWSKEQADEV